MRLIIKVIQNISVIIALWVFLTATSLIFDGFYSNAIVLYVFCGAVIFFAALWSKTSAINDLRTEEDLEKMDLRG